MSAYLTFDLVDGQGAIINANSVIGVIYRTGNPDVMGTSQTPLELILSGGETLPGVVLASALGIMNMVERAKKDAKLEAAAERRG